MNHRYEVVAELTDGIVTRRHSYSFESGSSFEEAREDVGKKWGSDGNYGCDCNRMIFLYDDISIRGPCSEGKITLLSLALNGIPIEAISI